MGNCQSCNQTVKSTGSKSITDLSSRKLDVSKFGRCGWCMFFAGAFGLAFYYLYFVFLKFIPGHAKIEYILLGIGSSFMLLLLVHFGAFAMRKFSNKKRVNLLL